MPPSSSRLSILYGMQLTDETEIVWGIAEKLAERSFTVLDYYRERRSDTGAQPTAASCPCLPRKCYTQPLWTPSEEVGGDRDKQLGRNSSRIWNSDHIDTESIKDNFGTATGKFEFYSETLKGILEKHAATYRRTVDEAMAAINYAARGESPSCPDTVRPAQRSRGVSYIFSEHRSRGGGRSANTSWYQNSKDADPGMRPGMTF